MGWDDNGLPTERRVQNYFGVRCDPSLPYQDAFTPPHVGGEGKSVKAADQIAISRRNFVELCERLTVEDEQQFEALWRHLGLSVDWSHHYQTIDERSRAVAQRAFLLNLARGEAYQAEAPGLWDVTFQTAVAQAELEAREYPGHFHRVAFHAVDGRRAGLHRDHPARADPRRGRAHRAPGRRALPGAVRHHGARPAVRHRDPRARAPGRRAGQGRRHRDVLHVRRPHRRAVVARAPAADALDRHPATAGCCATCRSGSPRSAAQRRWVDVAGKTAFSARAAIVDLLRETGDLDGEPTPTQRMANFYEKGDKPLEIVTSRQWYIRNGGRAEGAGAGLREALLARGRELAFHPEFMRVRYENWVGGLNGDWLISRQRFFGVAIPLWYPLTAEGDSTTTTRSSPTRPRCRSTRAATCRRATPPTSAASPGASSARPTSWTPGRRARSRRRSPAAGAGTTTSSRASSRWTSARRARTSSARGCSPRWCARTSRTAPCPGRTRRSAAGSSTPTARRCRSPRATS